MKKKQSKTSKAVSSAKTSKKATAPGKTDGGEKTKRISGLDAAAKVLAESAGPLGCKEIVERMLANGYWQTKGLTPGNTLYAAILREIKTKGDASRFRKADRGKFEMVK